MKKREMANLLNAFVQELCTWVQGNGDGLTQRVIEKMVRLITLRLQFWSAPTKLLILTHQNYSELNFEVSKEELLKIIQSRDEDREAKEYVTKNSSNLSLKNIFVNSTSTSNRFPEQSQSFSGARKLQRRGTEDVMFKRGRSSNDISIRISPRARSNSLSNISRRSVKSMAKSGSGAKSIANSDKEKTTVGANESFGDKISSFFSGRTTRNDKK